MMRVIFWVTVILLSALAVLVAARFDEGYVLIVFPPWRVELSFVLMVVLTFGLFVLTCMVLKLLRVTLRLPTDVRAWQGKRRRTKADDDLSRALAALIAGEYSHARKLATKAMKREETSMAVLVAARSAAEQGERVSVEDLLGHIGDDVGELVAARQAIMRRVDELATPPLQKPESGTAETQS